MGEHAAGIRRDSIETLNFSVYPEYITDERGENPRVRGYRVTNQVSLKTRRLDAVGTLIDAALALTSKLDVEATCHSMLDVVQRLFGALGGLDDLQRFEAAGDVNAELLGRLGRKRLRLGLHDVRQRGVARLVKAQVGGDDRRQIDIQRLQAAIEEDSGEREGPYRMRHHEVVELDASRAVLACEHADREDARWSSWMSATGPRWVSRLLRLRKRRRLSGPMRGAP